MSKKRILVVDDEENVKSYFIDLLNEWDYEPRVAENKQSAMTQVAPDIDLVLIDVNLPGKQSFEIVERIRREENSEVPIIVVTSTDSGDERSKAVQAGATDFIAKPFNAKELRTRMNSLLRSKDAQDELKSQYAELEQLVQMRTSALVQTFDEIAEAKAKTEHAYHDMIRRLVMAAEYRDATTATHIQRMREYCVVLAEGLGMSQNEITLIAEASPLHDIGKIAIPDAILLKPGKLNSEEWKVMQSHTLIGANMLAGSSSELLQAGELIALSHHEKWDGSGYPNGLAGEAIPIWGRICAIADVFDALTADRPYKQAFPNDVALGIIKESKGYHFEPELVDLFVDRFAQVMQIQQGALEVSSNFLSGKVGLA